MPSFVGIAVVLLFDNGSMLSSPEKGQMDDHYSLHWKLHSICDTSCCKLLKLDWATLVHFPKLNGYLSDFLHESELDKKKCIVGTKLCHKWRKIHEWKSFFSFLNLEISKKSRNLNWMSFQELNGGDDDAWEPRNWWSTNCRNYCPKPQEQGEVINKPR